MFLSLTSELLINHLCFFIHSQQRQEILLPFLQYITISNKLKPTMSHALVCLWCKVKLI